MNENDSFDLAAAGLRADGAELARSIEVLASKLERALPGRARVQRRGGGLLGRGPKRVRQVQVEVGSCRYELEVEGERVEGSRHKEVGGIAIKRETLGAREWIDALTKDLRAEASSSEQARDALEKLLG